jgi:hypothetical protein
VTGIRFGLARLLAAILSGALFGCGAPPPPNADGVSRSDTSALPATARTFLSTLNASQRADATFPFDDPERTKWAYVPQRRAGIPLKAMEAEQRAAAFGLLGTGLSDRGTGLARGIIELEGTLGELEGMFSRVVLRRDPERYYLSLFVGPGATQPWGGASRAITSR